MKNILMTVAMMVWGADAWAGDVESCRTVREAAEATVELRDAGLGEEVARMAIPADATDENRRFFIGMIDIVYNDLSGIDAAGVGALFYRACMEE